MFWYIIMYIFDVFFHFSYVFIFLSLVGGWKVLIASFYFLNTWRIETASTSNKHIANWEQCWTPFLGLMNLSKLIQILAIKLYTQNNYLRFEFIHNQQGKANPPPTLVPLIWWPLMLFLVPNPPGRAPPTLFPAFLVPCWYYLL